MAEVLFFFFGTAVHYKMIKSKWRCNVTSILYVIGATLMAFTDSAVTRCHTLIYESLLLKYGASKEATAWVIGIRNMLVWGGGKSYNYRFPNFESY